MTHYCEPCGKEYAAAGYGHHFTEDVSAHGFLRVLGFSAQDASDYVAVARNRGTCQPRTNVTILRVNDDLHVIDARF